MDTDAVEPASARLGFKEENEVSSSNIGGPCDATRYLVRWHFLAALLVLILNDHWFKGAGILPGWLTGKLSDFAGLYLAPVLLVRLSAVVVPLGTATLGKRFLVACLLVGSGFTALQLSPATARLAEACLAGVGIDGRVTPDPSDLVALPMMWLGAGVYLGWFSRHARTSEGQVAPSWVERGVVAVSVLACVATSAPLDSTEPEWLATAPVVVNADGKRDVALRFQFLRDDVGFDCASLWGAPGRRLPRSAFGSAIRTTLGPGGTLPLEANEFGNRLPRSCEAVLLEVEGGATRLVFWESGSFGSRSVPATLTPEERTGLEREEDEQFLFIERDAAGSASLRDTGRRLVHTFVPRHDVDAECRLSSAPSEMWTSLSAQGVRAKLASRRRSADGCFHLEFAAATSTPPAPDDVLRLPDAGDLVVDPEEPDLLALDAGALVDSGVPDAGPVDESPVDESSDPQRLDAGTATTSDADVEHDAASSESEDAGADSLPRFLLSSSQPRVATLWLCVPDSALPFEVGDIVSVQHDDERLTLLDEASGTRLTVFREADATTPLAIAPIELSGEDASSCDFQVFENPPLTARLAGVRVSTPWGAASMASGEERTFGSGPSSVRVGITSTRRSIVSGDALGYRVSGFVLVFDQEREGEQ